MEKEIKRAISVNKKKIKKKLEKNILPDKYKIIDIIVDGRRVRADLNKWLIIANCENKSEVLAAQNRASSHYQYFARVESRLEDVIVEKEEIFDLWMAEKIYNIPDDKEYNSEAAKKRHVMINYRKKYLEYTKELRELRSFKRQAEIAKKTLDKQLVMLQSIGAMVRSDTHEAGSTSGEEY